jgi:hypothetical protein
LLLPKATRLLIQLIEGLLTSLKTKDHEIAKLMNKLESMNEGGQTSATKALQVDQLDVIENFTIEATRNIHGITNGIFTTNQLKELIKEAITNQVKSSLQPSYSYVKPYNQIINLLRMPLVINHQSFNNSVAKGILGTYSSLYGYLQQCQN